VIPAYTTLIFTVELLEIVSGTEESGEDQNGEDGLP
jgi:hypothetical protein